MDNNIGAPFSPTFFSDGTITAVDGEMATAEYRDKLGNLKSGSFTITEPLGFTIGERVNIILVDEFVFIQKK